MNFHRVGWIALLVVEAVALILVCAGGYPYLTP